MPERTIDASTLSELSLCEKKCSSTSNVSLVMLIQICKPDKWITVYKNEYLLCNRKCLHLNVSRRSYHRSLRLTGRENKIRIKCVLKRYLKRCHIAEEVGKYRSCGLPASHQQSSQQAISITGADLILVQQLVDHFLGNRRQTAGTQVKDDST